MLARSEEFDDFVEAKLEGALLHATLNRLLGQEALLFLQVYNSLLDGVLGNELVDIDIYSLSETVDTVNSLLFNELW